MSDLKINETGAYERDIEQNWAAAYAKRLAEQEAADRDQAIAAAVDGEKAAREDAVAAETEARIADDNAIKDGTALADKCIYSRHIREGNITTGKIHDGDVTRAKLNSDVFAGLAEIRSGQLNDRAVTPYGLKNGIGEIIPASVIRGDFALENIAMAEIDKEITSIFHNPVRDAGLRVYSTTPQQIGTWIDGTPVWRLIITDDVDVAAGTSYRQQIVKSPDNTLIIGCYIRTAVQYNACDSTEQLWLIDEYGYLEVIFDSSSPEDTIYGYIEFVTPEENIISD